MKNNLKGGIIRKNWINKDINKLNNLKIKIIKNEI